jgi:hypothetical protein
MGMLDKEHDAGTNEAGPGVELPKSDASLGTKIHSERLETLRFPSATTPPALSILVASLFPSLFPSPRNQSGSPASTNAAQKCGCE